LTLNLSLSQLHDRWYNFTEDQELPYDPADPVTWSVREAYARIRVEFSWGPHIRDCGGFSQTLDIDFHGGNVII